MSKYLISIYDHMDRRAAADADSLADTHARHGEFAQTNGPALRGGAQLADADTATSVRQDGSGVTVTDGVFVESKEILGGFYLIEAADLDEALAIAKQVPAPYGGV
ncbi:MAG: YciI family protein, partial [Nocardioidaceae bacterium]